MVEPKLDYQGKTTRCSDRQFACGFAGRGKRARAERPNPFNIATSIAYSISRRGHVSLRIYDVSGRLVRTLVDEVLPPQVGGYRSTWHGRSDAGNIVPSGVYFYKLIADDYVETRKMALIK